MKTINISEISMIAFFLIALFHGSKACAQSDSILIESEIVTEKDTYYKHKYQYLDVNLSDETQLFKFSLQPFKPSESYSFGVLSLQLAYEKKISRSISIASEINANMMWTGGGDLKNTSFAIGSRWYVGKNKRIQQGQSGNNCNGYYLGLKANNIIKSIVIKDDTQNIPYDRFIRFDPTPEISMGLQQRIANLFYVDASTFINYSFQNQELGFGLLVLFGISLNIED